MENVTKIGSVTIDLRKYVNSYNVDDSVDLEQILEVVKNNEPEKYQSIIEEQSGWPMLYHLSDLRANIINWLPMDKSAKVLEIGSLCGSVTTVLAEKFGSVTCLDLSKECSTINAYRNENKDNITIHVGKPSEYEEELPTDFDYVFFIGSFEYSKVYSDSENPYISMLQFAKKHIKADGRIVIAMPNKFGLKFWAGCREDSSGVFFDSLEGFPGGSDARTFTKNGLISLLKEANIENYSFYYPYPDYKFMHTLFSDKRLPNKGELTTNIRNFDRDRLKLFDESLVFNTIIDEKEFPLFSNSYMVVTGPAPEVIYSRFSNERKSDNAVRTDIAEKNGEYYVKKTALHESGLDWMDNIVNNYEKLAEKYKDSQFNINHCEKADDGVIFQFEKGRNLEELLDKAVANQDEGSFKQYLTKYKELISYNADVEFADYDCIFQNILVEGDKWTIIDYEWCVERKLSVKELGFRAWYCYTRGNSQRESFLKNWCLDLFGFSEDEIVPMAEAEAGFQKKVTGGRLSLLEIGRKIGNSVIEANIDDAINDRKTNIKNRIQIYVDYGKGFAEDTSFFVNPEDITYESETGIKMDILLPQGVKNVRIDPCMVPCFVTVSSLWAGGKEINIKDITHNGAKISESGIIFATDDPNMSFKVKKTTEGAHLTASLDVLPIDKKLSERI